MKKFKISNKLKFLTLFLTLGSVGVIAVSACGSKDTTSQGDKNKDKDKDKKQEDKDKNKGSGSSVKY